MRQRGVVSLVNSTRLWYLAAMKNTSVILGDHFADFIAKQIEGGRYSNTSDVVRSGLRLLEEHEAKLETLRNALIEGEQSGIAADFEFDQFIAERTSA